jgi:hypothetical protein
VRTIICTWVHDEGVVAFLEAGGGAALPKLRKASLGTGIGDTGFAALAAALPPMPNLEEILVAGHTATGEGQLNLSHAMAEWHVDVYFSLSEVPE